MPPQPAAKTDLGQLILIATPVSGVAAVVFAPRRDWMYVDIAAYGAADAGGWVYGLLA